MATYKTHLAEELAILIEDYTTALMEVKSILKAVSNNDVDEAKAHSTELEKKVMLVNNSIKRMGNLINAMPDGPDLSMLLDNPKLLDI